MRLIVAGEIDEHSADRAVAAIEGCRDDAIEVLVDSIGGGVSDAMRIASALLTHKAKVTATLCKSDSAALLLILGSDKTIAARDATALVHPLHAGDFQPGVYLTAEDLRIAAESMHRDQSSISALLGKRTNQSSMYWNYMMSRGERLTAEQLKRYGAVDEISAWPSAVLRADFVAKAATPVRGAPDTFSASSLRASYPPLGEGVPRPIIRSRRIIS